MRFLRRRLSAGFQESRQFTAPQKTVSADVSLDVTVSSDESSSSWTDGKRVSFAKPQHNQYIESSWTIYTDVDEADEQHIPLDGSIAIQHEVWYHKTDIGKFKSDAHVSARIIQARETHGFSRTNWSKAMWEAYQELQDVTEVEGMNEVMAKAADMTVDPNNVGLEKYLREGPGMRTRARRAMYASMAEAQASGKASDRTLRRICRDYSRTSRLYAIFVARAVAN